MSSKRITGEPAFVLHTYAYKETSLIVELFTRTYGRVGVLAKGARRPKSSQRGVLNLFQPIVVGWGGRGELKTLYEADWRPGGKVPPGSTLISGYYLNELLLKLMMREDPHEGLFDAYERIVFDFSSNDVHIEKSLRRFEKFLLQELGYGLDLTMDAKTRNLVDQNALYTYVIGRGPVKISETAKVEVKLLGRVLMDIADDKYDDVSTLSQSKQLMRFVINHYLGNKSLHTRKLILDLQAT